MDKAEVLKLARLARIEVSDEEAESLTKEIGSILNYVSEIKKLDHKSDLVEVLPRPEGRNVFREDAEPHEAGIFMKAILEQAPNREGDYIKVKKIL